MEDTQMDKKKRQEMLHKSVTFFEDAPRYEKKEILELHGIQQALMWERNEEKAEELTKQLEAKMAELRPVESAPERIYLWEGNSMPTLGTYTENPDSRFNHDPDFAPYMYALTVPEDVTPKGAVVVCAGGDHGDCTLHEGYQTCLDLRLLGYQCFLLLNRTNRCPYDAKEAGVDAARAIRIVRKNAAKYRFDENRVAFAGFSNGGLTAEACIRYYSGTQKVTDWFSSYQPDEYDEYYGAPDAVICVYGPRFVGETFDYTNVVYPPIFFAVGRDDMALQNLNATLPDLLAHQVEVEVHTFSGVPHGQSGVTIYGNNSYPHFQLWLPLADAFLQNIFAKSIIKRKPDELKDKNYHFDSFANHTPLLGKKKGHLPAMGWNSWNAFGSGNTEKLTKAMADKMVELGLDKLGYQFVVLDDGCYKPVRVDGKLSNEEVKFPNGFRALSDYIHDKGLKFGMYNDIGTNLCAGAFVGTCGHEDVDAQSYVDWGVDFLKVDNCYYLWDNATFSKVANARYVYAPDISGIRVVGEGTDITLSAVEDGEITGAGGQKKERYVADGGQGKEANAAGVGQSKVAYVTGIGTLDGTGPDPTPVGDVSAELVFSINVPKDGRYDLIVTYATATEPGTGSWLQVAAGEGGEAEIAYDDFLPSSGSKENFVESPVIPVFLKAGENKLRLMNHRRQENTLASYAALLEGLNKAKPGHDIIFSICEWGKTQPQNWGYKVGDSWRILNDITFRVGSDGDPGYGAWTDGYTPSVTTQYNKAVIMDEFAGPDKGWNDPDMLMIGMNGLTETMQKTHMAMWCMLNAPLMLGLDLRRVEKGDALWNIIANEKLIALNQDTLGVQAKRVASYLTVKGSEAGVLMVEQPDTTYLRNNDRVDILAKPLADGSVALSFFNVSEVSKKGSYEISAAKLIEKIGQKMADAKTFADAKGYDVTDLWTGETKENTTGIFGVKELAACDNVTIRVTPRA